MRKVLLLVLTITACSTAFAAPDSTFILSGTCPGIDTATIYLYHDDADRFDTIHIRNGQFELTGTLKEPLRCELFSISSDQQVQGGSPPIILAPGHTVVNAPNGDLNQATISGTAMQEELNAFEDKTTTFRDSSFDRLKQYCMDYSAAHPDSYVGLYYGLAEYCIYNPDPVMLRKAYRLLSPRLKATWYGGVLQRIAEASQHTLIGRMAPDFIQGDTSGHPVRLSSFRGKYVLVQFWASWCPPCRAEDPALVAVYKKYQAEGFTIIGVSLDFSSAAWREAIRKDDLEWPEVSDLKIQSNAVAKLYGIRKIPMNYLLDRTGKVIARAMQPEELDKKLHQLLK